MMNNSASLSRTISPRENTRANMNIVLQAPNRWPYARNSALDSVGDLLGTLYPGLLGGILYWEATGEARRLFESGLKRSLIDYLYEHSDRFQESGSYVSLPLYMIGKEAKKAKPTVLFVSDNKAARKEAFDIIKQSDRLAEYPGFEIGHTGCGSLENFAGEIISIHSSQKGNASSGYRLSSCSSLGSTTRTAMAGGIVSYGGKYMLLTVGHFLEDWSSIELPTPEELSWISDCEITGLSDSEDDDDGDDEDTGADFVEMTGQGSISDQDESQTDYMHSSTRISSREIDGNSQKQSPTSLQENISWEIVGKGNLVLCEQRLDYALIEVNWAVPSPLVYESSISLDDFGQIEPAPRKTSVQTTNSKGAAVQGDLSEYTLSVRLPQSKEFIEAYTANFFGSLGPGDCGGWVRDELTGGLFGHVFAGNLSSGLAAIMPARLVFDHARALLNQKAQSETQQLVPQMSLKPDEESERLQRPSSHDTNAIHIIKSLSIATLKMSHDPNLWTEIQQLPGLPDALRKAADILPSISIFLKSLKSYFENDTETKELIIYAETNEFAELCLEQATYYKSIFDGITSNDKATPTKDKYLAAAKRNGGVRIELVMKNLLQQAINLAAALPGESKMEMLFRKKIEELNSLTPSFEEDSKAAVISRNYGAGNQFYHGGRATQHHREQTTGDSGISGFSLYSKFDRDG
ncbi:hypothetical protein V8C35DRAFT_292119, partial [Trichoderma chlorosporum]